MISKELYCFTWNTYASVLKENASTSYRGILGGIRERPIENLNVLSIISSHVKSCNAFMGRYV